MAKTVVKADHITKIYPLYDKKSDRLIEALSPRKKNRHKDFYALRDISFDIKQGESVGFIGKNGSGKSTLLKILTGVLTPTTGCFTTEGSISALLELGAGFNMEYTGIENIYLNGSILGFTREEMESKIDNILEFADIGDFVYQPVKMYSSGMFIRLAFAVAINVEPDILIVDEALSVGDIFFQQKCYKKFEDFRKAGKTILFVTHDMGSVIKYCNRAFLLNDGELVSEGSSKSIVDQYKKLMAGISLSELKTQKAQEKKEEAKQVKLDSTKEWKSYYPLNPDHLEYGSKELEIIDFGIFDTVGNVMLSCEKGEEYVVKMKVKVNEPVRQPIFALSFKDLKGNEVAGTNTSYEKVDIMELNNGDILTISFRQEINLQNSTYFISLGCTEYMPDGQLKIYHRLYDVIALNILSEKTTVGWIDMNSEIEITREEQ